MSADRPYPVPWDFIGALFPHIPRGTRASLDRVTALLARRLHPGPRLEGTANIPQNRRFVVVANHYQRPGLWIAYSAAAVTRALIERFGPGEPPIRWVVTANWPPLRWGRWRVPSPGDVLLPRVAHALWCYSVPFAGSDPAGTAASIRRLLKDARGGSSPLGLFPEGVAGTAFHPAPPLPGTARLIRALAQLGYAVLPVRIYEAECLTVEFGPPIPACEVLAAGDAAELAMARVREPASRWPAPGRG